MIETYWNEVFGSFKDQSGKFHIPGFPEPLMSAHFGVKNIIGETSGEIQQTFKLCVFNAIEQPEEKRSGFQESLKEAILSDQFWDYQKQYNTYEFIRKLLPFLTSLPQPHYHLYLKEDDKIIASALVGVANCSYFLFNLSVSSKMRGRGYARILHEEIRSKFYDRPSFYWTVHSQFTFDAVVQDYHLLK